MIMKPDSLSEFARLRSALHQERLDLRHRLEQIDAALSRAQPPSLSSLEGAAPAPAVNAPAQRAAKKGPKRSGKMSAATRARIAEAARKRWASARAAGRNKL